MNQSSDQILPDSSKGSAPGEIGMDEGLCHHAADLDHSIDSSPALLNNSMTGCAGDGPNNPILGDDATGEAPGVEGADNDADHDSNGIDTTLGEACEETDEHFGFVLCAKDLKHRIDYLALANTSGAIGVKELHALNEDSGLFDVSPELRGVTYKELTNLVEDCVRGLDTALVVQLVDAQDDDVAVKVLYPIFSDFFMRSMRKEHNLPTHVLKKLMHASLESLVMCIRNALNCPGDHLFGSDVPEFARKISNRARMGIYEALREEQIETEKRLIAKSLEIEQHRRDQHASPTRHLEANASLSTEGRISVFINGVVERNKAGELVRTEFRKDGFINAIACEFISLLELRRGDRGRLSKIFSGRPYLTVENALEVLDWCLLTRVGIMTKQPANWKANSFYPSGGCNLSFFSNNFDNIVEQVRLRARSFGAELTF